MTCRMGICQAYTFAYRNTSVIPKDASRFLDPSGTVTSIRNKTRLIEEKKNYREIFLSSLSAKYWTE